MALLFSHVRVSTPNGNETEFLVSGIPRELEDFDYYTKFEDFIDSIEEDTEITVCSHKNLCRGTSQIRSEALEVARLASDLRFADGGAWSRSRNGKIGSRT